MDPEFHSSPARELLVSFGDDYRGRALLQFAGEEAKHIHRFKRFRQEFEEGFGSKCDFIGPAEDVSRFVLSHSLLGVARC